MVRKSENAQGEKVSEVRVLFRVPHFLTLTAPFAKKKMLFRMEDTMNVHSEKQSSFGLPNMENRSGRVAPC